MKEVMTMIIKLFELKSINITPSEHIQKSNFFSLISKNLSVCPKCITNNMSFYYCRCTICLDEFVNQSKCRIFLCHHLFHQICIDEWIKKNSVILFFETLQECPLCKRDINEIEEEEAQEEEEDASKYSFNNTIRNDKYFAELRAVC